MRPQIPLNTSAIPLSLALINITRDAIADTASAVGHNLTLNGLSSSGFDVKQTWTGGWSYLYLLHSIIASALMIFVVESCIVLTTGQRLSFCWVGTTKKRCWARPGCSNHSTLLRTTRTRRRFGYRTRTPMDAIRRSCFLTSGRAR